LICSSRLASSRSRSARVVGSMVGSSLVVRGTDAGGDEGFRVTKVRETRKFS
jgi:hypothetical protein